MKLEKKGIQALVAVVALSSAMLTGCGNSKNDTQNQAGSSGVCSKTIANDYESALKKCEQSKGPDQFATCKNSLKSFLDKYPNIDCVKSIQGKVVAINYEEIQSLIDYYGDLDKQTGGQTGDQTSSSGVCSAAEINDLNATIAICGASTDPSQVTACKNALKLFLDKYPKINCETTIQGRKETIHHEEIQKFINELEKQEKQTGGQTSSSEECSEKVINDLNTAVLKCSDLNSSSGKSTCKNSLNSFKSKYPGINCSATFQGEFLTINSDFIDLVISKI